MIDIQKILSRVPDYKGFLTVEEMDRNTLALAEKYPDAVSVSEIGRSRWDHPIYCLTIGKGSQSALLFGCPHPNEPIGAMMLEFLTEELAKNDSLREELDYTFYIVKSSDPDGTSLNEGWFKGPFTVTNYQRNFYRPAFHQQVEWSFPVEYKTLKFDAPIPETRALMKIIDEKQPTFIYSLHNSGFGGCYWYLSEGDEALYRKLYETPAREQIPLSLGEPEMPYCVELYPAIYQMIGVKAHYDYLEKFVPGKDPASLLTSGTCSDEYANRHGTLQTRALINEMPYFFDARIDDTSPSDMLRRDAILQSIEETITYFEALTPIYERVKPLIHTWNPFFIAMEDRMSMNDLSNMAAKRQWAQSPEFAVPATVAQKFENLYGAAFYRNLNAAILRRACVYELEHAQALSESDAAALRQCEKDADKLLSHFLEKLEQDLDYSAIPIQKLVRIQLASGLIYAQYAHQAAAR